MTKKLPSISIIVPVREKFVSSEDSALIKSIKRIDYPLKKIELLTVKGRQPSRQRNLAVKKAKGEIVYFLDDDSLMHPRAIKLAIEKFSNPEIIAIGGPALTRQKASFLEKCFGFIHGSVLGGFHTRYRHRAIGKRSKVVKGEELILCNLFMRRDIYLKEGGLKDFLYPNEENEFLKRLSRKRYKFIYDPKLVSFRPRRKNILEFIKQNFNYGRGRMEHFLDNFRAMDLFFIAPTFFLFYLLSLFFYHPFWFLIPLIIYLVLAFLTSIYFVIIEKKFQGLIVLIFLLFITHIFYGLGFFWGLLKKILITKQPPKSEIKVFKANYHNLKRLTKKKVVTKVGDRKEKDEKRN